MAKRGSVYRLRNRSVGWLDASCKNGTGHATPCALDPGRRKTVT